MEDSVEGSHPPFLRTSSRFKLFLWTKVLLLDHNSEPCAALLLFDKTLQEFGIGRPPTHELFLDPFLCLFVSSFKTNKQTLYVLVSTLPCTVLSLVAPDWHKFLLFSPFSLFLKVWSQYVLKIESLPGKLLENCSQMLSLLSRSSRHLRRFVLEPFSVRRLRHDCKSIRVCQTCNSRWEKREVGIVKCAQKKGFWTIQCVGGSASTQPLGGSALTQPLGPRRLESRWVGFDPTSSKWCHLCLLSAWTCPHDAYYVSYSVGTI